MFGKSKLQTVDSLIADGKHLEEKGRLSESLGPTFPRFQ